MTNIDPSTAQRQADFIEELEEKLAELKSQPVPDPSSGSVVSGNDPLVQLMVRIPQSMQRRLKATCSIRGESLQDVVRDLVAGYLANNEGK